MPRWLAQDFLVVEAESDVPVRALATLGSFVSLIVNFMSKERDVAQPVRLAKYVFKSIHSLGFSFFLPENVLIYSCPSVINYSQGSLESPLLLNY